MNPKAALYFDANTAIVAAMHSTGLFGILYEQETAVFLKDGFQSSHLGDAIKKALAAFSIKEANLRDRKSTDWTAFRISGCTSVKKFEKQYRHISIDYINPKGGFAKAEIEAPDDRSLGLFCSFNPRESDLIVGDQLRKLMQLNHRVFHENGA